MDAMGAATGTAVASAILSLVSTPQSPYGLRQNRCTVRRSSTAPQGRHLVATRTGHRALRSRLPTTGWLLAIALLVTACGSETSPTSGSGTTTSPIAAELTVEQVVAWVNASFAGSPLVCDETGAVAVGSVLACGGPPTAPASTSVDYAGTVIYVLDETGRAVWTSGTDVPGPTADLLRTYQRVPKGLFCRDLLTPETDAFPFSGNSSNPRLAFFWSLVYWSLEGKPDRMDADRNGIPCETLYEPAVIDDVLAGGPAGE